MKLGKIRVTAVSDEGVTSEEVDPGTKNPFQVAREAREAVAKQGGDPTKVDVRITSTFRVGRRG